MRSPVFVSNSSVLTNLYGEHRSVGFFFLNTGGEIGRVELPQWVWEQPERLALVHALVWDQVTLGRGYPIALAEAHEQAVVANNERSLFFDLVRRAYGRHDVAAELSAKALRKRGPIA
jgi:NurA domain-containing protein